MYVSHILQSYRSHKNWNPKYIYYIYCDHNIRKSNNDIEIIQRLISEDALHITTKDGKKKDEATLRKRRYEQINKYAKQKNIAILIT
jgi:tRNA(Ile)-lysidine synthase TilS/MesJ